MHSNLSPVKTLPGAIHGKSASRRGFLKIAALAATVPALAGGVRALAPQGRLYDWQLDVMGALSELALWHDDPAVAGRAIREVRAAVDEWRNFAEEAEVDEVSAEAIATDNYDLRPT